MIIFQNDTFYIETEPHELPWVKIFTAHPYKELSELPKETYTELFNLYRIVEEEMRSYFQPDKINMASFANMLPRVHLHVIARYENDAYFPNPVWGEKLRESDLKLAEFKKFYTLLSKKLQDIFK